MRQRRLSGLEPVGDVLTDCYSVRMTRLKKLTQSGNSVALVLDKELLEAAGLEAGATVEIDVVDGVISIGKSRQKRAVKIRKVLDQLDDRYAAVFKKLAE